MGKHALHTVSASPRDSLLLIVDVYRNYSFISEAYGEIQFLLGGVVGRQGEGHQEVTYGRALKVGPLLSN